MKALVQMQGTARLLSVAGAGEPSASQIQAKSVATGPDAKTTKNHYNARHSSTQSTPLITHTL